MFRMPGKSHAGPLPPLTGEERALAMRLEAHVRRLAGDIGERNVWHPGALAAAAQYIDTTFGAAALPVISQEFAVEHQTVRNIEAQVRGVNRADEIIIVGAHYDSVLGCPGANDNATGVAAALEIARWLAERGPLARTVGIVAFVNEEPPFFQTPSMGSLVYARRARARGDHIVAMLSLETIGWYSDAPGSQRYPLLLPFGLIYPTTANFLAFVGNRRSRALTRRAIGAFRLHTAFPSEGAAVPEWIPGIGWSDHWAFWQQGYPAVMVTDTALYRYRHYHTDADTPDKVDYATLARVAAGLARVVEELALGESKRGRESTYGEPFPLTSRSICAKSGSPR
jgi:Zn-dependent M28 family amino/carboxypeptidase